MNHDVTAALDAICAGSCATELESAKLEFKSQGRVRKDTEVMLAEAAACFANAAGGTLVVGVRDSDRGPNAIEGCTIPAEVLQRRIFDLTDPRLVLAVEPLNFYGKQLLMVAVPSSPDVHQVQGRATERIGNACEPMSARRIAQIVGERRGDDWSAIDSDVPPDRASVRALEDARRLLSQAPDPTRRGFARERDGDLLRRLGLITPTGTLTTGR